MQFQPGAVKYQLIFPRSSMASDHWGMQFISIFRERSLFCLPVAAQSSKLKVHKAVFEPPDSITISFVRDRVEVGQFCHT